MNELFMGDSRESVYDWERLMFLYNSAIKELCTKLEIMRDEFQFQFKYNPIEQIESRLKTPESIVAKMTRDGHEVTMQNMVNHVNDIAGVRVVCSFTSDIYHLADMIRKHREFTIDMVKDYIKHPKHSGYRSYHMMLRVPVQTINGIVPTKVELQIRTIAMDFWASLEHKIYYKFEGDAPEYISKDLKACAAMIADLDDKMMSLNEVIQAVQDKDQNRKY